jgi:hypothetical protein
MLLQGVFSHFRLAIDHKSFLFYRLNINKRIAMTLQEMINQLNQYSGQVATVTTERPAKVYKDVSEDIRKRSTYQVRFGVAYGNQAVVKEKHESGEVEKVGLPAGWTVISPVAVKTSKGDTLLRAAPSRNTHSIREAEWFLNGKPVEKSQVEHMLTAAERKEYSGDWIYIKPENFVALNGQPFKLDA